MEEKTQPESTELAGEVKPQEQKPQAIPEVPEEKTQILKRFPKAGIRGNLLFALVALLVVLLGVGTGWLLSGKVLGKKTGEQLEGVAPGAEKTLTEAGIADEATFRDSAEGILEEGGVNGEGTHHLVREGGPSQYVYLTSTVIDLQSFVGKTVKVWGETIGAQEAGWLMDVGKIKVIE